MVDDEPSGPQRDLWALPSEELPPGAAVFLDMARDLQAGLSGSASASDVLDLAGPPNEVVLLDLPGVPGAPGVLDAVDAVDVAGASDATGPGELGAGRPHLQLVGPSGELEGPGGEGTPEPDGEPGAQVFLEMVDRADTVRPLGVTDAGDEPAIPDWLWSEGEEGIPASEVLLSTIERAIQHVNHSEDIRSEEVRSRLLDLFTDFAVRRPWREEERPEVQRIQRLPEQPPDQEQGGAPL